MILMADLDTLLMLLLTATCMCTCINLNLCFVLNRKNILFILCYKTIDFSIIDLLHEFNGLLRYITLLTIHGFMCVCVHIHEHAFVSLFRADRKFIP